jgi:hypothetical protein
MQTEKYIPIDEFCACHDIEIAFIHSLQETGLIEIIPHEEAGFIHEDHLLQLEKIVRLYYELNINLEGIESIAHLLERVNSLQDEIRTLRNRLRFYEPTE